MAKAKKEKIKNEVCECCDDCNCGDNCQCTSDNKCSPNCTCGDSCCSSDCCDDCDCCDDGYYSMPLIGDKAPHFNAITTNGPVSFPEDYKGSWVILFSHPADFTPVCTTEFMTFASREKEFNAINCKLIGLSIDSIHSHIAWLNAIENCEYKDIKNMKVTFPIIDDVSQNVAFLYGMIHPNEAKTSAVRAVFVIDPEGTVRTILYYPASTGRNFDEILRIVKSLQTVDKEKCATPADWQPGEDVIVPPAKTTEEARKRLKKPTGMYCKEWFLCFKKSKK